MLAAPDDQLLPEIATLEGYVAQRSPAGRRAPPADYVLCDPSAELPVVTLVLERRDAGGGGPAWRRCKLVLWGFWCEKLAPSVALGCKVTVNGAEVEPAPDATDLESPWQLSLPPKGASPSARVVLVGEQRTLTLGATGAFVSTANAAPAAADSTAPAGGQGAKRPRRATGQYAYSSVERLRQASGSDGGDDWHCFGVVVEYQLPRATKGTDLRSVLHLVDESCASAGEYLALNCFKAHPHVPGVGAVVRLHRLKPSPPYDGVPQAHAVGAPRGPRGGGATLRTQWVFGDGASPSANRSAEHLTWSDADSARVEALARWSRAALSTPGGAFAAFRQPARSLAGARELASPAAAGGGAGSMTAVDLEKPSRNRLGAV